MDNNKLKLEVGDEVSVEMLKKPGVFYKCIVMDVGTNGGIKFLVQDIDRSVPKRMTLKSFMDGADISQKQLAVMLDVSESTVSRYMTGRVPIPDSHFIKLGIPVDKTIMQRRRQQDKLITVSETLKSKVKELDNIINGLEGLQ